MKQSATDLIKNTILHQIDCETLEEAIEYFEEIRHKEHLLRTKKLFKEISRAQIAILFKLLIDLGEVDFDEKENVIRSKEKNG